MNAETSAVKQFGYLAIGVNDLDEAINFYGDIGRLELTERVGRTAFMTGGTEHHWIRLEEGSGQGVKRIGYELVDESAFADIRDSLKEWEIDFTEGSDPGQDRVSRWLRFCDPGGTDVELYTGMWERGVAPLHAGVSMEKFLHGGWQTKNFAQTTRFYKEVLGFKVSDWIGDKIEFLRAADRYHHSLVLVNSNRAAFDHFCIQVSSIDDVMRFRNNARRRNVALRDDILRHAPSGSISVYVKDEARGLAIEFCTGHPQLDDDLHKPRILPMSPESADIWQAPLASATRPGSAIQIDSKGQHGATH